MTIFDTCATYTAFGRAVFYDLDHPMKMHVHSALHVLLHLGGEPATYTFGDGGTGVSDGRRVTFVDPWVPHTDYREGHRRSQVLALYIEPTMIMRGDGGLRAVSFKSRSDTITATNLERADALADLMREGRDREDPGEILLDQLAASLVSLHAKPAGASRFPNEAVLDRHVRAALKWLNARKGEPFFSKDTVEASGLSRSYLFERFREATGMTPKRYADALRIEEAIRLLAASEESIAVIAARLGFDAPGNLSRFMRDLTGLSPREHRKAMQARGGMPLQTSEFGEE